MANISLKSMLEASIDPKLVARSKESGKLVYFKSPEAKANALKAGSHEEPKKDKKSQAKQAAQSADMFKGDYAKERELPTDDFSDIKGPNPNKPGWSTEDVFAATFKDPETGKTITVGDAYDREDGSPAYEKAFAYAAQFNPDDEELISGPGSKADVKSIVKGILKTANKEFAGAHKLKDIVNDVEFDTTDDDGKELQSRIDKGEDGVYVQTDETEGTVVFSDGTQYQLHHVEDGPIPVTKVGAKKESTKLTSMIKK